MVRACEDVWVGLDEGDGLRTCALDTMRRALGVIMWLISQLGAGGFALQRASVSVGGVEADVVYLAAHELGFDRLKMPRSDR